MKNCYDLFNPIPDSYNDKNSISKLNDIVIPGLTYIPEFISESEEIELIEIINNNEWITDLKRRVQHFGWRYDYRSRNIDYSMKLGPLPSWADYIALKLYNSDLTSDLADQVIINEYRPGQGISNHIDCEPCFGNSIVSLSLGSTCIMNFINTSTKEKIELVLEPRSIVIIKDESRYLWSHGISSRLADPINNSYIKRKLRLSLTFRKVIVKDNL